MSDRNPSEEHILPVQRNTVKLEESFLIVEVGASYEGKTNMYAVNRTDIPPN